MLGANPTTSNVATPGQSMPAFRRIPKAAVRLLLASLLWMGAAPSALPINTGPSALPFRSVRGFAIIVPAFINGSGPYPFLLDTGSTCTTVDRELAEALHLQTVGQGTVTTVVRPERVLLASALTVSIGPVAERNVELLVRDLDGLRSVDRTIRGVLGQNALKHADFLIDYRHRVIQFDPDSSLISALTGQRIPLTSVSWPDNPAYSVLAVSTRIVDVGVREKILVLDSGTASLVLFSDRLAPRLSTSQSSIQNVTGNQRVVELRNVQLRIGGKSWDLAAHSLSFDGTTPEVNGLLPMSLFPSLYISNGGRFVVFAPKRKRRSFLDRALASLDRSVPSHADKPPGN